jgi:hypothetical protein
MLLPTATTIIFIAGQAINTLAREIFMPITEYVWAFKGFTPF